MALLDPSKAEAAAMDHIEKVHGGPQMSCEGRTPVEQLALERRHGLCDHPLEEIYGEVEGWVNPNA